jgi:SAM-dependent methyltransferase
MRETGIQNSEDRSPITLTLDQYRKMLGRVLQSYQGSNLYRILDVGCGSGGFLTVATRANFYAVGLEGDQTSIQQNIKNKNKVIHSDLENDNLPIKSNSFDVVHANQFLEHLSHPAGKRFFYESYRILRPGGLLIIRAPSYYNRWNRTKPFHLYCWRQNQLYAALKEAKFTSISQNPKFADMICVLHLFSWQTRFPVNRWWERKPSKFQNVIVILSKLVSFMLYKVTKSQVFISNTNFQATKK